MKAVEWKYLTLLVGNNNKQWSLIYYYYYYPASPYTVVHT